MIHAHFSADTDRQRQHNRGAQLRSIVPMTPAALKDDLRALLPAARLQRAAEGPIPGAAERARL